MKKIIGMMACLMACAAVPCFAANDGSSEYDWPPPTGIGRGIVNIVTSPCEIARDISYYGGKGYESVGEHGAFFGGIFGIIPGAVMTVARIGDGVLDCFTLGIWETQLRTPKVHVISSRCSHGKIFGCQSR